MHTAYTLQAAQRWGMTLLTMQGKSHTDGIVACISVALGNLTSHAAPAPPPATSEAVGREVMPRFEPGMHVACTSS